MYEDVKRKLIGQQPIRLANLPTDEKGLYILYSHKNEPLYLGITAASGFRSRVYGRHVTGTGSDGNSHKFGWGYNVGPFYLAVFGGKEAFSVQGITVSAENIKLVRRVRAAFLREHCRATAVQIERPKGLTSNKQFKTYLATNYETPIKRELALPWQDSKADSVVAYDAELNEMAWRFLRMLQLTNAEMDVFTTMERLFNARSHH
jgi:hypothetical protein